MSESLGQVWNVLLIVAGFGFVIFIHELGHFAAARWARVRVHAFAIGFGPAIGSWRKGMGFRWGSSEREYVERIAREMPGDKGGVTPREWMYEEALVAGPRVLPGVSPTEYRLNWIPFGGYVKMLGQEDANPAAVSDAPDSFGVKPVRKRMVIISAGVVMNIILAAVLFVIVFLAGIREIAPVVGYVQAGSPAERAGVRVGDIITHIGGERVGTFSDVGVAAAMNRRDTALDLTIERIRGDGAGTEAVALAVIPKEDRRTKLLQMGVAPAASGKVADEPRKKDERELLAKAMEKAGLSGVEPGSTLVAVDGQAVAGAAFNPFDDPKTEQAISLLRPLERALEESGGRAVEATFRAPPAPDADGTEAGKEAGRPTTSATIAPVAQMEEAIALVDDAAVPVEHLLGFTPVMGVREVEERAAKKGLHPGDIFARLGNADWPDNATGLAQIRAGKGKSINVRVLRAGKLVDLNVDVDRDGTIGFERGSSAAMTTLITRFPAEMVRAATEKMESDERDASRASGWIVDPPAPVAGGETVALPPVAGLRPQVMAPMKVMSIGGRAVGNFVEMREALIEAIDRAASSDGASIDVELALLDPKTLEAEKPEKVTLALSAADILRLRGLGWKAPAELALCFEPATVLLQTENPLKAMGLGVQRTKRAVLQTYITFLRLFEGSVKVEHLKGPVGIAHVGSRFAEQGFIYLLFFLAMLSANLAVINFLPLPIVDGGLMVFLLVEGITKRPVSVRVQNATAMAGLLLIGAVFILVTYNDLVGLFTR
ncbi:MAG TPA: site-2 protease family protein [Phycisphaerales bacterium]|nr:site-2 protease family protein [Phycisphaerales bacterium]